MSDKDNPFGFGDGGERTVIRPNPGNRLPPAPPSPPPQQPHQPPAPAAPRPYSPETAPAYSPRTPPPSAYSQPPRAGDDWIASAAPRGPVQPDMRQRAEDLRFEELAAQHDNPVMRAAGPLLLLLGRLRVAALRASFASLMEQVAAAINFFDKEIRSAGIPAEQANIAKYLLCATADDIVQNIPTEDRHVWTQYSMLSRFFGERIGGVRFFDELDRLKNEPVVNYNVLELQHACLALGFQGVHRTSQGGAAQLQLIQRNLYETLRRVRPKTTNDLSPAWRGQALAVGKSRFRVPVWITAGVVGLCLFGLFILLRTTLSGRAEAVAAEAVGLHPMSAITLQRRLPSPPPKPEPTPTQMTQLERIRAGFAPEIKAGSIAVEQLPKWIAIRVGNLILFDSGKADVKAEFGPIAKRIAEIVDKEEGPVRIVGHTDSVPLNRLNRFKDNQNLSVERARAVQAAIQPGISDPSRLTLEGKGPDEPIADNKTPQGRAQNRRVEILITRTE